MAIKSNKLYIVGNGFDLHHRLATSYWDFAQYLKRNNGQLYDTLESYILYPSTDKNLWSNFEENLANLDVEEVLSEHSDSLPDYGSDDFRDRDRFVFPDIMSDLYRKLTSELFEEFRKFILAVDFPTSSYEFKLHLDKSARFLTFNYTDTLSRLYKVTRENIVYIHNSARESMEIVLGHGTDPRSFEERKPVPPDGLSEEELADWNDENDDYEYSFDEGKRELSRYFGATYKPTKEIIHRHKKFFEGLKDIDEVVVLGHSLSSVDLPYFKSIAESVCSEAHWRVSYYSDWERENHVETLKTLGIDEIKIELFQLSDIQESNLQLQIDFD